jgi:predicted RNA-binding Zn-ribbon protein involved in translation (DUF1610 family)
MTPELKKDKRECPICGERMDCKFSIESPNGGNDQIFQCPKCKNIEQLWEDA